jgi:hypothetical protein
MRNGAEGPLPCCFWVCLAAHAEWVPAIKADPRSITLPIIPRLHIGGAEVANVFLLLAPGTFIPALLGEVCPILHVAADALEMALIHQQE